MLAALLVTAAGAAPARAQPEATGEPEAASAPRSREPTRDPARPALPEETAADEAPQIFVPSEEISGDTVVSFPVDI
ncbi:MAG: hypothetical protein GWN95_00295 [Gammaproteobacteria bacterium]|nr:hypothetical protein [Gammaproteobacteria bacterium]